MKVWVITCTSYSPNYAEDGPGYFEHKSVLGVRASEASAREIADSMNGPLRDWNSWQPLYEVEDFEVEE